jgi:hypothetical protein
LWINPWLAFGCALRHRPLLDAEHMLICLLIEPLTKSTK